jgi:hypothetical protein
MMDALCFMANFNTQLRTDGISVYSFGSCGKVLHTLSDKASYKVLLLSGTGTVNYGDRSVEIEGSVLLIAKPGAICSWSLCPTQVPSYTCIISSEFFQSSCFNWVEHSNLFSSDKTRVYNLSADQSRFLRSLFQEMIGAHKSAYALKSELIQDQICVLLHTAMRLTPSENYADFTAKPIPARRHVELAGMMFPSEAQVLHLN